MEDYRLNVQCGKKWLDDTYPGWRGLMDVGRMDISQGANCVLGQLYCVYGRSVHMHGWERADAYRMGFSVPSDPDGSKYRELTALWREEIVSGLNRELEPVEEMACV